MPQSRLLVIEGWGGFAQMGNPVQYPGVYIRTIANGSQVNMLVFAEAGGGGWFLSDLGSGLTAHADPDSTVEVSFARNSAIGKATMTLVLTGHYVDQ